MSSTSAVATSTRVNCNRIYITEFIASRCGASVAPAQESFQNLLIQEGENADQFTCLADLINAGVDQAAIRCATSIQIIAAGTGIVNGCPDGCGVFYDVVGSPSSSHHLSELAEKRGVSTLL